MDTKKLTHSPENARLLQLQHELKTYKLYRPAYFYAAPPFIIVGSTCSIIRYHKGWSWEEAGLWLNLGFWTGYLIYIALMACFVVGSRRDSRKLAKLLTEFKEEKKRRGFCENGTMAVGEGLEKQPA
jgi:hypothetical protein